MIMYGFITHTMLFLQTFVGLILIAVILLQRGRGGGLAGAFGGMGGQSAFGTKAGDVFTKITIVLATVWIVLGCVCVLLASGYAENTLRHKAEEVVKSAPANDDKSADGEDKKPGNEDSTATPSPSNTPETKVEKGTSGEEAKKDGAEDKEAPADKAVNPAQKPEDGAAPAKDGNVDAKGAPAEKPAEPAKKPDGEAEPAKEPTGKKPD